MNKAMIQTPRSEDFILKWRGDTLNVELRLDKPRKGRAALRTNLGRASVRRNEIITETERGETPLAKAWTDIPLTETEPGVFRASIPLDEVGIFSGKTCFFPAGKSTPEWPIGRNFHVKVESAETLRCNSVYTVFPRQFGSFREVARRLPLIMDEMGFRIIQTLPPFPVPTTYAVMGEFGCPFAATDFYSVDPAMAEFDPRATPLDQFRELIGAVHARRGLLFVDLPANHTGWASTLQTHHPEWFRREADGKFISPGAWGVTWEDLVELDYSNAELCAYMADVFLFWCRNGVDGFRCDAGYMIPAETWSYIVARVREEYPDTVFMLEGLGGDLAVTDRLLAESNLDWAYSEIFQTYDRRAFEWYLPQAIARSEKFGTLIHFAETHDNDRLAKGGEVYARLRVQLSALLSWQGAWGIANGVEWYCREKIDVHGKNSLNWGSPQNMVALISKLNFILADHPSFTGAEHLELITAGDGNTLAVRRGELLVLANLDCNAPVAIDWDRKKVSSKEGLDLLTERKIDLSGTVRLDPGEVLAVQYRPRREVQATKITPSEETPFHIVMPRDEKRILFVPEGQRVNVAASSFFRLRLIDPESGKTLRVLRSAGTNAAFTAPPYEGDGTRARRLRLEITIYENGRGHHVASEFLIPPTPGKAAAKLIFSGAEVRRHRDWRTVLANSAGAASQVRLGWGEIFSQYDAFLAANPNPTCPSDRINLWTRTRCWLQREGYTREVDAKCLTKFTADPAGRFARWDFTVPCGMGGECAFSFILSLSTKSNAAQLKVTRTTAKDFEIGDSVRLVFRPDVEWRSFHATTKAYAGAEGLFPSAVKPRDDGFVFAPYDGQLCMKVSGGMYHHEPEWRYGVQHSEEAARGQEGAGDLFSPGWISADLKIGDSVVMTAAYNGAEFACEPIDSTLKAADERTKPLASALRSAMDLFIVRRDDLKTVIAGYPWFLDWGRDTFIFMRGMIAAGMKEYSLKILKAFAAFEENGTLPNIIYGNTAGNRDTTDAQLWFIRCVEELETKDKALLKVCNSIVDNYIKGTPNGIRVDAESGLVFSPSHFTWMDTNYPACTPRVGYPIEIQALWISALKFLERNEAAAKALDSVKKLFKWEFGYRDCLAAPNGESAANAVPEDTIRPNQLFLITLGILDDPAIVKATEELLVPGGIRSLNQLHRDYRGNYAGDEDTSRKPAYHNGTVWAWPFPSYAEALAMTGGVSKDVALSLLASAVENLNEGCIAHISEIADGDAPHAQKGCTAQAWSVSELLRVWLKLSAN